MTTPLDVLSFWCADGPDTFREAGFKRDDAFDAEIRDRFGGLSAAAGVDALASWRETSAGVLALAILLDQFPRNLHRGRAEAFAADPIMRDIARDAVLARRIDLGLTATQRVFLYLPFEHSGRWRTRTSRWRCSRGCATTRAWPGRMGRSTTPGDTGR